MFLIMNETPKDSFFLFLNTLNLYMKKIFDQNFASLNFYFYFLDRMLQISIPRLFSYL